MEYCLLRVECMFFLSVYEMFIKIVYMLGLKKDLINLNWF